MFFLFAIFETEYLTTNAGGHVKDHTLGHNRMLLSIQNISQLLLYSYLDLRKSTDGPALTNGTSHRHPEDHTPLQAEDLSNVTMQYKDSVKVIEIPSTPPPEDGRLTGMRAALVGVSPRHMTKAEKKKLEWERQRGRVICTWVIFIETLSF